MQLVIEITKEHYEEMIRKSKKSIGYCTMIARGIPLPEKHGRLIDADDIDNITVIHNTRDILVRLDAPTIIEATEG